MYAALPNVPLARIAARVVNISVCGAAVPIVRRI